MHDIYLRKVNWEYLEECLDNCTSIFNKTLSENLTEQQFRKMFPIFLNEHRIPTDTVDGDFSLCLFKLYTWDHEIHDVIIKVNFYE